MCHCPCNIAAFPNCDQSVLLNFLPSVGFLRQCNTAEVAAQCRSIVDIQPIFCLHLFFYWFMIRCASRFCYKWQRAIPPHPSQFRSDKANEWEHRLWMDFIKCFPSSKKRNFFHARLSFDTISFFCSLLFLFTLLD